MDYSDFVNVLKQCQTPRIKVLSFPESCAPHKIPSGFLGLLPAVVQLLNSCLQMFCRDSQQVLALFGLQLGSVMINSDAPLQLQRVIDQKNPRQHLCCSLAFLTLSEREMQQTKNWQTAHTLMIDFTTGLVMDGDYYTALVMNESPSEGVVYGTLDTHQLTDLWKTQTLKQIA